MRNPNSKRGRHGLLHLHGVKFTNLQELSSKRRVSVITGIARSHDIYVCEVMCCYDFTSWQCFEDDNKDL